MKGSQNQSDRDSSPINRLTECLDLTRVSAGMQDGRSLNRAYGEWFGSMITEACSEPSEPKAILFITLTFEKNGSGRRRRLAEGQAVGELELDAFNHLYSRVCRDVVGRNYHRESHRSNLPKVLAFIDAEGSRYWSSMRDAENLHVHSIWVVPANRTEQLERSLRRGSSALNGNAPIDAIDIKPIDHGNGDSILRTVSYSSKMMGFNSMNLGVADDFRVLPH